VGLRPGAKRDFSGRFPFEKIPGIGEVTERALRALGIETVEQIAAVPQEKLETIFGNGNGAVSQSAGAIPMNS